MKDSINLQNSKLNSVTSLDDQFANIKTQVTKEVDDISGVIYLFRARFSPLFKIIHEGLSTSSFITFKIVFGLFISFAVIGLGILILHTISNKIRCKSFVNSLWFVLCLLIVAGLVLGGVLGLYGASSGEATKIIPIIFSFAFLRQDFSQIILYVTACLEVNGNLMDKIGINLEPIGVETIIPESQAQLNEFITQLDANSKIEQIQTLMTTIQTYHDNCSSAFSSVAPNKFTEVLQNLNSKVRCGVSRR